MRPPQTIPASSDIERATCNWREWKRVFEHQGSARQNPLFTEPDLFGKFLYEYSVSRTVRKGQSRKLRQHLCSDGFPLDDLLSERKKLDDFKKELRGAFGSGGERKRLTSLLSKIATFLAPSAFIAWDQFARIGLSQITDKGSFNSYQEYLDCARGQMNSALGKQLRVECASHYPSDFSAQRDRFHLRVLDVSLMRLGGRWSSKRRAD